MSDFDYDFDDDDDDDSMTMMTMMSPGICSNCTDWDCEMLRPLPRGTKQKGRQDVCGGIATT